MAHYVRATESQSKATYKVLQTDDPAMAEATKKHCERGTSPDEWSFGVSQVPFVPAMPEFDLRWLSREQPKEWSADLAEAVNEPAKETP